MSKRNGLLLFLAIAALFLIVNHASYKGFFTDDDFEHLSWTRHAPLSEFITGFLSPRFQANNFRPAGHFFYHEEFQFFGFDFQKFLAATHALHLLNIWLLWLVARRLGAGIFAAAAGCTFFALHPGYFEAVWKPAYIFDVLCATFSLLCLLFYMKDRRLLAFICFWAAYKSKELGVMLPFVLAAYELWFGKKRWQPLFPFFLASGWFALQALVLHPNGGDTPYTFHFTIEALALTSVYYAQRVFLIPYLGFFVLIGARFSKNHRIWFGTTAMVLFLFPMLFLPGRLETAYVYLPFTGLALALTGVAEMVHPAVIIAGLLLFAPLELHELRMQRRDKLGRDDDARAWVSAWQKYAVNAPQLDTIFYQGSPNGFGGFGIEGAIKCLYPHDGYKILYYDNPPLPPDGERFAVLTWNHALHKVDIVEHGPDTRDASFIDANDKTPVWQLGAGWSNPEGGYRWIGPETSVQLARPDGAAHFELRVLAIPDLLKNGNGTVTVTVSLNGVQLPPRTITQAGWQTLQWDLPPAGAAPAQVQIQITPPFRAPSDPRTLGIPVASVGFK